MDKPESISVLQAVMLVISAIGVVDHVIIIPMLLKVAGRDAWAAVSFTTAPLLVWTLLLWWSIRKTGRQPLFSWLKRRIGNAPAWFVIALVIVYLFAMSLMTIRDVTQWANFTYLPKTPNAVLVISFLLATLYASHSGVRTIAITNGILLPVVIVLGFFVMTSNFVHKDYTMLYPVFEQGVKPVLQAGVYAGAGFSGMIYFMFLQHRLRSGIKLVPLLVTALILAELTLSPLTGAIAAFGPNEASRMRFPAYEQWRLVTFGHYFEHVDFFSIYQWFTGAFTLISLSMVLIAEVVEVAPGRKRTALILVLHALLLAGTQIQMSETAFLQLLVAYYMPAILILALALSILIAVAALLPACRKGKT